MGCFSYLCPICGKNIRSGEDCVLVHKRDGVVIGRTAGHYDGYGRVEEDDEFRGDYGENSHDEICVSEFGLASSFYHGSRRIPSPGEEPINISLIYVAICEYQKAHTLEEMAANPILSEVIHLGLADEAREDAKLVFRAEDKDPDAMPEAYEALAKSLLRSRIINLFTDSASCQQEILAWAESLPRWDGATSGIIAAHSLCCKGMSEKQIDELPFSLPDPDQGCGGARKKFM